jgi:hypothetical protein
MNNVFDLQRAIAGEPIETVAGEAAEFIAYRPAAVASVQLIVQVGSNVLAYYADGTRPRVDMSFDLHMKSVVNQIDWAKLPVDTLITLSLDESTANRYFSSFTNGRVYYYRGGMSLRTSGGCLDILTINPSNVRIAPDQPWTVWLGGDCPPMPDGLEFEYMIHSEHGRAFVCVESASAYSWRAKFIYAYRPTGRVLGGWTL